MIKYDEYQKMQDVQSISVMPMISPLSEIQVQHDDDIEVIDLDNPNRDVKPTTWHRN